MSRVSDRIAEETLKREASDRLRRLLTESGVNASPSASDAAKEAFKSARMLKPQKSTSGVTIEEIARKRRNVELELIATEKSYIASLKLVQTHFLTPVRAKMEALQLTEEDVKEIFGNIEAVLRCSEKLLSSLLTAREPASYPPVSYLTQALVDFGSDESVFAVYKAYVNNYSLSQRLLSTARTAAPEFAEWLKKRENSSACGFKTLTSLLVGPIQRIPRYMLLCRELRKQVLKEGDISLAEKAVDVFEKMAQRVNDAKQAMENSARIISSMDLPTDVMYLLADGPMLAVQQGEIALLLVHVFLFSDMIVCTRDRDSEFHLLWRCDVINCTVIQKGSRFIIKEECACDSYPFVCILTHELVAMSENASYWAESMSNALASSWEENEDSSIAAAKSKYSVLERNSLSAAEWDLLHAAGERLVFSPNAEICTKGMANDSLWCVVRGSVRVEIPIQGRSGTLKRVTVATTSRGDFFGEMSLLSENHKASATIVAEGATLEEQVFEGEGCPDETELIRIPAGPLHTIMITNQHLALRFYTLVATKLALRFLRDPLKSAASKMSMEEGPAVARKKSMSMSAKIRLRARRESLSSGQGSSQGSMADRRRSSEPDAGEGPLPDSDVKVVKTLADGDESERVSLCVPCSWGYVSGKFYVLRTRFGFIGSILRKKVVARFTAKGVYAVVVTDGKSSAGFRVMVDEKHYQEFTPKSKSERDKIFVVLCSMVGCASDMALESIRSLEDEYATSLQQRMLRRSNAVHLVPEDWVLLSSATKSRVCHPGEVILAEGQTANRGLYQVVKGYCIVEKVDQGCGQKFQIGTVDDLSVFGLIGFVLGVPATASVVAGPNGATVLEFSFDKLRELFESSPDVGAGFYQFLAVSISQLFLKVESKEAERIGVSSKPIRPKRS